LRSQAPWPSPTRPLRASWPWAPTPSTLRRRRACTSPRAITEPPGWPSSSGPARALPAEQLFV